MALMEIEDFHPEKIKEKLKKEGTYGHFLITIVDYIFSDAVQDIVKEFDDVFSSDVGNKAYPRTMLLGIYLYCYKNDVNNINQMVKMCRNDRILRIFTCDKNPSYSTLKRFLKEYRTKKFKRVFLYTLVELNDLKFLKFLHLFIDGSDAIIRGSKFYKLTRKELKTLKLLKKYDLLLKNRKISNKNWTKKIMRKINENADDKIIELLKIALENPYKFTKRMSNNIPVFEKAFQETEKDYICIVFPQAVLMPTKKGGYDFAFNLQQIMNENNITIGSILLQKPNDFNSLNEVILDLKENFQILAEMIEKYGNRKNLKEIKRLLEKAIFIMDAGYFSDNNLETAEKNEINALIMPKGISIEKNQEFRKRKGIELVDEDEKSFNKKDFKRENNGYRCPNNQKLELTEIKEINSIKNREDEIPESWIKKSFIHVTHFCSQCHYREKCVANKASKTIIDNISQLSYDMSNKFTNQRYLKIYSLRLQVSESINGFLKTQKGILLLSGSDENEISNEIHLKNTVYNLTRKLNLKDTLY